MIYQALHVVFVGQVTDHDVSASALGDDVVGRFLGLGLVAAMHDDDGAFLGQCLGNALADTFAAACDQGNFSVQLQIHRIISHDYRQRHI
ncbi:hypothetical protein D3C73_1281890 [compost metagenome]